MKTQKKKLNPNARKWVKALRSGKYKQCSGVLTELNGQNEPVAHCCLGVACDLFLKSGGKLKTKDARGVRHYEHLSGELPEPVMKWLGLADSEGRCTRQKSLVNKNDTGTSFSDIAKIIESMPQGLFV